MQTFSIVVDRRPGLLAQIVSVLVREGCRLLRQSVAPADLPSQQRFTITVDGTEVALSSLALALDSLGSVEMQGQSTPAAEPSLDVDLAIQEIVASFPDVAARVRALARALPKASRAQILSTLGERLGRRKYARDYALGSPLKLEPALRRMVLPAVRQLAKAELDGSVLRLPGCPFCGDADGAAPGCDFVVGFARGLLHAAPATAGVAVREGRCQASGDPFCELVFLTF